MTLISPVVAEEVLLDYIVGGKATGTVSPTTVPGSSQSITFPGVGLILHLYVSSANLSNNTPSSTTTLGSFTEAPTSLGYSYNFLTYASWWITTDTNGTPTAIYNPNNPVTFTFTTGPVSVYGYYVTDSGYTGSGTTGGNNLLWAEAFTNAPFTMPTNGGTIAIQPQLQLS